MYNCTACAKNPALKVILGHDGPPTAQLWTINLITEKELDRCPLRTLQLAPGAIAAELQRYQEIYVPAYEAGHLLMKGGLADQPARYLELVQLTVSLQRRSQAKYDELTKDDEATE